MTCNRDRKREQVDVGSGTIVIHVSKAVSGYLSTNGFWTSPILDMPRLI